MKTRKEVDKLYLDKFIDSMENDYDNWEKNSYYSWDYANDRYLSPKYGNIVFGFDDSPNLEGAWIDGFFKWEVPRNVLFNPLNPYFWKYRNAKKKLKKYISNKLKNKETEELINEFDDTNVLFNEIKNIKTLSQFNEDKLLGNQKHPKSNHTPPPDRVIREGELPKQPKNYRKL